MITQKELKALLTYNPKTGGFTRNRSGKEAGGIQKMANSPNSARYIGVRSAKYRADRLAILYMTGELPNYAYHKDHNQTNDKYSNLLASDERPKYRDKGWYWTKSQKKKIPFDPRNKLDKMLDNCWRIA